MSDRNSDVFGVVLFAVMACACVTAFIGHIREKNYGLATLMLFGVLVFSSMTVALLKKP